MTDYCEDTYFVAVQNRKYAEGRHPCDANDTLVIPGTDAFWEWIRVFFCVFILNCVPFGRKIGEQK